MENRFNIGVYLAVLVALFDQMTKFWFLDLAPRTGTALYVFDWLNFRLGMNRGVTFGLFHSFNDWMPYILIVVALLIIILLLRWLNDAKTIYAALGIGFVMGGAVGNVIDRLRFGAVIDFIDFHIGDWHWYTFNLADSAICLGVGLLLLESLVLNQKQK